MTATKIADLLAAANLADATDRLMLADAYEDAGRDSEAAILRDGEPMLVINGHIWERQHALDSLSTSREQAAYVSETHEDGSPARLTSRYGHVWEVVMDDAQGNMAVTMMPSDATEGRFAGLAKWSTAGPILYIRYAETYETFGVQHDAELVCLGGRWEDYTAAE